MKYSRERFSEGVRYFTRAKINYEVSFPENEVRCCYCPFCRAEEALGRWWCRLTNEMLYNPYSAQLGEDCPMVFGGEIEKI